MISEHEIKLFESYNASCFRKFKFILIDKPLLFKIKKMHKRTIKGMKVCSICTSTKTGALVHLIKEKVCIRGVADRGGMHQLLLMGYVTTVPLTFLTL